MAPNRRDVIRLAAGGVLASVAVTAGAAPFGGASLGGAEPGDRASKGARAPRRAVVEGVLRVAHPAGGELELDPSAPSLVLRVDGQVRWRVDAAGGQPGQLNGPSGLAVAADGRCFLANTGNDEVLVFGADGRALPALGGPGSAPGAFARPRGLAFAADGSLWVADSLNHRVQVFDAHGKFLRALGEDGQLGDLRGTRLNAPTGVAFDADGSVWVADSGHRRLARFETRGGAWLGAVAVPGAPAAVAVGLDGALHTVVNGAVHSVDVRGAVARWQPSRPASAVRCAPDGALQVRTIHA
jgi:DNA-binding beta-propeller fold protein YncE